jgi:hypothetical protein
MHALLHITGMVICLAESEGGRLERGAERTELVLRASNALLGDDGTAKTRNMGN